MIKQDFWKDTDPALVLGPQDRAVCLGEIACPTPRDPQRRAALYAVAHCNGEAWTHLYRVMRSPYPRDCEVRLEGVWPGENIAAAASFAAERWSLPAFVDAA